MKTLHEKATLHATNTWLDPSGDSREMVSLSEYTAFIAGYETLQHETRWRSIEEELPECGSDFIAKMNKEHPFKDEVEFTSIHILYKRTSEIDADCLDKLQMDGCTHWKPIE